MKKIICAIFDKKTGSYDRPMVFLQAGEAIRSLSDVVADKGTVIGLHPSDFRLDKIGVMDMFTGQIDVTDGIDSIVEASSLVVK